MRPTSPASGSTTPRARRAFTLIEAMIATSILAMSVLALSSAIAAGQKNSIEGQKTTLGSMAVADLLSELASVPYASLKASNGLTQAPGAMQTLDGAAYPSSFWLVGRKVAVADQTITEPSLNVTIKGVRIVVTATDDKRDLVSAEMFVPEPGA